MQQKYSSLTILTDIDDVLNNLCSAWCEWLNKEYDTSISADDVTEWDISKFFPALSKEQVFEPLHIDSFWETVKVRLDAIKYVKKLFDEGYDIYLCTSTDYRNIKIKYELLIEKYFPYIGWNHVIVVHNKQMVKADYLIDDAPHNLEGGSYKKLLFTAPHNKNYNAELNGIVRVNNWREIYEIISKYPRKEV